MENNTGLIARQAYALFYYSLYSTMKGNAGSDLILEYAKKNSLLKLTLDMQMIRTTKIPKVDHKLRIQLC